MTVKTLALTIVLMLGLAFVETGQLADLAKRFERPPIRESELQVQLLEETPEYRLVKHPLGETRLPLKPKRIVSLTNSATDSLCALGVKPVLIATSWRLDSITPYLSDQIKDIPRIRYGDAVDLEAVLATKPDLIFAGMVRDGRLYNQLSKIAPTVCVASRTSAEREQRVLDVGRALGMEVEAQRRLDQYQDTLQSARATLAHVAGEQPVSFLRFRRNSCVIYTQTSMFGPLLFEELGLSPDPEMPMVMTGGGWDVLSVERLSQLQSEYIFMVVDRDSEIYLSRVRDTPIWKNIPAVKHEHVCRVASGTWLSGDGVLGCEAIVEDVLAGITAKQSYDGLQ